MVVLIVSAGVPPVAVAAAAAGDAPAVLDTVAALEVAVAAAAAGLTVATT